MLVKNFKQNWIALVKENLLYFTIILVLSVVSIVLTISLVNVSSNQRVILVPALMDKQFSYEGNKPSRTYLEMMGLSVVSYLMNYNPHNVKYKFARFLSLVAPEYHDIVKEKLSKIARQSIKYGVSQAFAVTGDIKVFKDRIELGGILYRYSMGKLIESTRATYVLKYRINKLGKFEVLGYEIKDKNKLASSK